MTTPTDEHSEALETAAQVRFALLVIIVTVWGVITVGIAYDAAEFTQVYQYLTLFVAVLASRYWGLPKRMFLGSR